MRWPGQRALEGRIAELETRAEGYTDALVSAMASGVSGEAAASASTAALEAAAGLTARSFAVAQVDGPANFVAALTPPVLAMIGRALIRRGEIAFRIGVDNGAILLQPAQGFSVQGGPDPAGWTYELTLAGPSRAFTYKGLRPEGVVHIAYAREPNRPWRGLAPLQVARLAGRLSAETVAALADEASGPRGSFLPVPADGEDGTVTTLKADIRKARGAMLLAEGGDWDKGDAMSATSWKPNRFGPSPSVALVSLAELATKEVLAAVGLSPALFSAGNSGGAREAWRQALHGLIQPLGQLVQSELRDKLDPAITLSFNALMASDLTGRARAFQSMVGAGMDIAKAAGLSGLMDAS